MNITIRSQLFEYYSNTELFAHLCDDGDDDDEDKCFPTLVARGQAAGWEPMEGWPGQWGHWPPLY